MRLEVFICAFLVSAGGSIAPRRRRENTKDPERALTDREVERLCPSILGKRTVEAGAIAAKFYSQSAKGIPDEDLIMVGQEKMMHCVRLGCPEAIPSLARAIAVHDPHGTLEGMKAAIGSLDAQVARKLFKFTHALSAPELADVVLHLYQRARIAANMQHVSLVLTPDEMRTIGSYSWIKFGRS